MALTEQTLQDKIEIVGVFKHVQVRTARVIYDNDVEISRSQTSRAKHLKCRLSARRFTLTKSKQLMLHTLKHRRLNP